MNISIRKATPADFPGILALIKEFALFQQTPEKVKITLQQMEAEKDIFQCIVAETGQREVIGFASFFYAYYSWSGKALYLDDLYIKAGYRKQGAGTQLLNAVTGLAKTSGCKKLRWQVSNWNKNAIDFYKNMGASIDEVEINCELNVDGYTQM